MIKAGKYEFHPDPWDNISEQAKDLVRHCLDVNYKTRYKSSDALIHPWISNVISAYLNIYLIEWKASYIQYWKDY